MLVELGRHPSPPELSESSGGGEPSDPIVLPGRGTETRDPRGVHSFLPAGTRKGRETDADVRGDVRIIGADCRSGSPRGLGLVKAVPRAGGLARLYPGAGTGSHQSHTRPGGLGSEVRAAGKEAVAANIEPPAAN